MVIADTYPLLEVFWTMLVFFAFVVWIWLMIDVFIDLFRRSDCSGWIKVLWIAFVIVVPYVGVFVYIIAEHKGMAERAVKGQQEAQEQFEGYVKSVARHGDGAPADQIEKAKQLLDSGAISQAEYDRLKSKALAHA